MKRKKIVWLCSWYPSKGDPFNGDFVQRHAQAAALFNDITVIHVYADPNKTDSKLTVSTNQKGALKEVIVCFRKQMSFLGRLRAHIKLIGLYRKVFEEHIRAYGKPDAVHVHVPVWAGTAAVWIKKRQKVPYVVTEHWGIYNDIEVYNYHTKSVRFRKTTKTIFKNADVFLSVSRYIAQGINNMVCPKKYELFPNVVDTELFYPVNKHTSMYQFIHVSNMVPLKNAEGILTAFSALLNAGQKAALVMVGPVPSAIMEVYNGLAFPQGAVRFTGEISYDAVSKEMRAADCLVLFSKIENAPCVIGEALCCGLPVISTAVGGIPELLDQTNSIMVSPGNILQLSEAMKRMVETHRSFDPGKIAALAKEKFSYASAGKIMDEVYGRLSNSVL